MHDAAGAHPYRAGGLRQMLHDQRCCRGRDAGQHDLHQPWLHSFHARFQLAILRGKPVIAVEGRAEAREVELATQFDHLRGGLRDMAQVGIERDAQAPPLGDGQHEETVRMIAALPLSEVCTASSISSTPSTLSTMCRMAGCHLHQGTTGRPDRLGRRHYRCRREQRWSPRGARHLRRPRGYQGLCRQGLQRDLAAVSCPLHA